QKTNNITNTLQTHLNQTYHQIHNLKQKLTQTKNAKQNTKTQLNRLYSTLHHNLKLQKQNP
ncbi:hypothetical protein, partial [Klebsiella pneumoniae]|uniref:hypothetical protein n=1 Tax=Klebsiella pneumoniae TaxID=573 RepID=UPI00273099AE